MKIYSYKDLKLSNFCLGCAQFGQKYGIADKKTLREIEIKLIVEKAIDSEINFFDTAADYGKSEEILGKVLKPFRNLVIATKIKHLRRNTENPRIIKKEIKNSLESSLKKLQRNYLDVVYIHQYQLFFKFPEIFLKILSDYKSKGLVRYIGISLYWPKEADEALKYNEIDVFQIPYNVLNRNFEEVDKISLLKKQEKLILLRSIFLQGLFFIEPDNLPKYFDSVKRALKIFYGEIQKYFNTKEEFFLGYALKKNYGPIILGVSSLSQLLSNLSIFNSTPDKKKFKMMEKKIPHLSNIYIDPGQWYLNLK